MKLFRIITLAALLAALFVLGGVVSADCPDDDPRCTILPPVSQEVGGTKSEGVVASGTADTTGLTPLDPIIPMPPPPLAESIAESLMEPNLPTFETLSLPLRHQDPSDPTCGAQALGMALDGLSGGAPSSSSLWKFLEDQGMTYDFGTGVEELAHAAQSFGYAGSVPFHDATLVDLMAELEAGRPVVISLGANGEGQPGHFVTLTGISPDGAWVSYNDPILGKLTLSTEDFMAMWGAQGNSGVRVAQEPLMTAEGELNVAPWIAMAAGLMALVSTTPMVLGRKGIGGILLHDGSSGGSTGNPPGPAPAGYYWTRKLVTRYKIVMVQNGMKLENRTIPRYERQRVQVGTTTVYDRIPQYKTVWEQDGWDTVKRVVPRMVEKKVKVGMTTVYDKIPQYKTVRVQNGWKTVTDRVAQYKTVRYVKYYRTTKQKVKRYRYVRGRRRFAGYRYITKRKPVYGTKKKFNGYKKVSKRVPNYVDKRVPDGFKVVTTQVPKYETRMVQDGWTTAYKHEPHMVQKQVIDSWEVVRQVVPKYEWQDVKVGWATEKVLVPNMVEQRQPDGIEVRWELERLPKPEPDPEPDYNYEQTLLRNRTENYLTQQSTQASEEPILEPVPALLEDPLGWIQAKLINAGRKDEETAELLTNLFTPLSQALQSIPTIDEVFEDLWRFVSPERSVNSPILQEPTPNITITPIPTQTPSPLPPNTSIWGTQVPEGWTPTPSSTPSPTGTPTADQILEEIATYRQNYLDSMDEQIHNCHESSDFEACLVDAGQMIYDHHGLTLTELAIIGEDNPINSGSDEINIFAIPILANSHDPVITRFLGEIGLSTDDEHWANFEPAFLDALKNTYPNQYLEAEVWAQTNEEVRQYREEVLGKVLQDWIESPFIDMYAEMYFGTSE